MAMRGTKGSRQLKMLFRLWVLATLMAALLPALPAAADDPAGAASADVGASASAVAPLEKKVYAPDGAASNLFGGSISISGDLMVVGARQATVDGDSLRGAAYLFGRNVGGPGVWGLIKILVADDGEAGDGLGCSVSISGSTVVVGTANAEAVYVFERDAGGLNMWGQAARLTAFDGSESDEFGCAVAIHGNFIVVGAYAHDVDGHDSQGSAYVFGRNVGGSGNWGLVAELTGSDGAVEDAFGDAVAINGAVIVVGASYADRDAEDEVGVAYIFERDQGGVNHWGEVKRLMAGDHGAGARFGGSVAVSGNTVVVGARTAAVYGTRRGSAYVFERDQNSYQQWGQTKQLLAPDGAVGNMFGWAVAISDATIVVGAPRLIVDPGERANGAAYVFGRNTTGPNEWGFLTQLLASDRGDMWFLGASVAMDATTIVAGADLASGAVARSGAAYIYTPYALRVNSAGPKYIDTAGNLWVADRSWLPGVPITPGTTPWGYVGGIGRSVSAPINGTEDDKLYQSERLYTGAVKPGYKFVLPDGRYKLTFKVAEIYWNAAGKRKFTVMAEGKICFANYDPYIAAGGAKNMAAPDKTCYVNVSDGMLELDFISVVGQAKADAIYIQQLFQ